MAHLCAGAARRVNRTPVKHRQICDFANNMPYCVVMGNITLSLQRLGEAIDRLDMAVTALPAGESTPSSQTHSDPQNRDSLRAEVAATIAELDHLIGQHHG